VHVIRTISKDAGVLDAVVVVEARGLGAVDRSSMSRDVVALDFFANERHLIIDAVMTPVYRTTVLQKVAAVPRYATKQAENIKFLAYMTSTQIFVAPHGCPTSWSLSPSRMKAYSERLLKPF
jgi:hypothetical protein